MGCLGDGPEFWGDRELARGGRQSGLFRGRESERLVGGVWVSGCRAV